MWGIALGYLLFSVGVGLYVYNELLPHRDAGKMGLFFALAWLPVFILVVVFGVEINVGSQRIRRVRRGGEDK